MRFFVFVLALLFAAPAMAKPAEVAPLAFTARTLPNGLQVYSMPDPDTANVAVHVWYRVGSKDDPAGRSGFAHLFEHIMFKATRNMPPETFDRLTEDVGGMNNASTWDDFTNYYAVVPANHLQRILWAEAERMGSLVVQDEFFQSERDVVKEEYRQRILAQPYGKLFGLYLSQAAYSVHPYGRPGIGSIADLNAATLADVRQFHYAYYRPDNAILVVSGRFDQKALDAWVDQYFGPLKSPRFATPRVKAVEPPRRAPRVLTVYEDNTPLPAIVFNYPVPAATHPDFPTLTVISALLGKGDSSRLHQSLVYTKQVATEVFTDLTPSMDPGTISAAAILSEGKKPDDGVQALADEIAKLRATPVSAEELDKVKNQILAERLGERETAFGRAFELAFAATVMGDPRAADKTLAAIQAVTPADVQRVAKAWLNDQRRLTIRYLSAADKPPGVKGDVIASAKTIVAPPLKAPGVAPVFTLASAAERQRPPAPLAPVSARIPPITEKTLANGLKVFVAPRPGVPLVAASLSVAAGDARDPAGKAGLADLVADLLTKGTPTRAAPDIARQIEALGATLGAGASADGMTLSLTTRSDRADDAFAIMADCARNATFAAAELDRSRRQTLDGLSVSMRQPGALARMAMQRAIYGEGPYGGVATPKSLAAITAADAVAFHRAGWRPDGAHLVIVGAITPEEGVALAQKWFGDWSAPAALAPPAPQDLDAAGPARQVLVIDLPGTGQAAITMGARALKRTDADFFPALVANTVLGGGYSARLNQEIRIKRGLSYGASASLSALKGRGRVMASAQTKNESAVEVLDLMKAELARLGAAPAPADELAARKATLIGGFGRDVETNAGTADEISEAASFGLPTSTLSRRVADIDAVTPEQAQAAAARLYDPAKATVIVAGDAKVFFDALKAKEPAAQRIPADKLELDPKTP